MTTQVELNSLEEFAKKFWQFVGDQKIFAFHGHMGSGKTTTITAMCKILGVNDVIGSPTFSIINEYESERGPVFHIDLYRCRDEEEAIRAGVEDCIYSGCLCLVEWPAKAPSLFPEETIRVSLTEKDEGMRAISVT